MGINLSCFPIDKDQFQILAKDYQYQDRSNYTSQFIDYYSINGILKENGQNLNFTNDKLIFGIVSSQKIIRLMQFKPKQQPYNQTMVVYVGKDLQAQKDINSNLSDCRFNMSLNKGFNLIQISLIKNGTG
jgi:hypothetical protein